MLVSQIEKELECVVCGKKELDFAYPDEDETVCDGCLDIYLEEMSEYLRSFNSEEVKYD